MSSVSSLSSVSSVSSVSSTSSVSSVSSASSVSAVSSVLLFEQDSRTDRSVSPASQAALLQHAYRCNCTYLLQVTQQYIPIQSNITHEDFRPSLTVARMDFKTGWTGDFWPKTNSKSKRGASFCVYICNKNWLRFWNISG